MTSPPTVSVVIPAYKAESTVIETLDSVIAQTAPVQQVVVVDDVSPDATVKTVQQWQRENPAVPLILVEQVTNGGPAEARNAGISRATGDWIAFLDSDDAWLPEKMALQLEAVTGNAAVGLVCGRTIPLTERQDRGQAIEREESEVRVLDLSQFVAHNPVATSTVMARRDVLLDVGGFDGQFCGPEDYDLWLRIVAKYKCLDLGVPLSRYRQTVGSLSMDERTFLPQVLRVLKKAFSPGGALENHQDWRRRSHAEQYSSASWMAYNRGANGTALRYLLKSWLYDMRRLHKEEQDPLLRLKLLFRYLLRRKPDVEG